MLGRSKWPRPPSLAPLGQFTLFALRQGFGQRPKRLYAPKGAPHLRWGPFVADREIYSSSEVSSRRVTARLRSSNCLSSAPQNQFCGDPRDYKMLGRSKWPRPPSLAPLGQFTLFALRQGFGQRPKRLYAPKGAPHLRWGPFVADREIYSSSEVSSRRVTARLRSSSCLSSTKSGQLVMGSLAFCTLGKAMTSRMDSAPAISMHRRSRP